MRGRRPKPLHVKLVTGNPGKRPMNGREPKPRRALPTPPTHITQEELVHWGRFSEILDRMGVLTEADGAALERVVCLYQEVIELREVIETEGRTYTTKNRDGAEMTRPQPAVAMLADCDRRFRGWLGDFGLTPAARTKVIAQVEASTDPGEAYFE